MVRAVRMMVAVRVRVLRVRRCGAAGAVIEATGEPHLAQKCAPVCNSLPQYLQNLAILIPPYGLTRAMNAGIPSGVSTVPTAY